MESTLLGIQADAKIHPARDIFLIPAMQDPASFHAIMGYIGFTRDEMYGRPTGTDALFHKLEAIKLVNERLNNGTFDDATIDTVTLLWTQEV